MLRTLRVQEPELVRQCNSRNWSSVLPLLKSHPHEAVPSDACFRGDGSTALALAVRCGAPLSIVEAFEKACPHQVAVMHRNRGSVLHEAIQHRASNDVLWFLIQVMSSYQKTASSAPLFYSSPASSSSVSSSSTSSIGFDVSQFTFVGIQDNRVFCSRNLFLSQDAMGRTALHLLVEWAKTLPESHMRSAKTRNLFRALIFSCPEAVSVLDCDGNTPLLLLLLLPRGPRQSATERFIFFVVHLMISVRPEATNTCRRIPKTWKTQPFQSPVDDSVIDRSEVSQSPLYFALLNGRSLETILLLIQTSQDLDTDSCCGRIVTANHEVPLHIAVSTRAPLSILYHIASSHPQATVVEDVCGLTSIDWLWIRHVLDWHASPLDVSSSRIISRRRFLDSHFPQWHELATRHMPISDNVSLPVNPVAVRGLQEDLLQRMKLFLPLAASALADKGSDTASGHWSLLHAACYVSCPIAMVRAALALSSEAPYELRSSDLQAGRLPLHYAATRAGYVATVPVGVTRCIRVIREPSAVFDVAAARPEACTARDAAGQLPLHIAIDTAQRTRARLIGDDVRFSVDAEERDILSALLFYNPGALDARDGKTRLYPWQQAAIGAGASLDTIYFLFRRHPVSLFGGRGGSPNRK